MSEFNKTSEGFWISLIGLAKSRGIEITQVVIDFNDLKTRKTSLNEFKSEYPRLFDGTIKEFGQKIEKQPISRAEKDKKIRESVLGQFRRAYLYGQNSQLTEVKDLAEQSQKVYKQQEPFPTPIQEVSTPKKEFKKYESKIKTSFLKESFHTGIDNYSFVEPILRQILNEFMDNSYRDINYDFSNVRFNRYLVKLWVKFEIKNVGYSDAKEVISGKILGKLNCLINETCIKERFEMQLDFFRDFFLNQLLESNLHYKIVKSENYFDLYR